MQMYGIYFDTKKEVLINFPAFEVADATYNNERFRVRVRNYVFYRPISPRKEWNLHAVEYSSYTEEISLRREREREVLERRYNAQVLVIIILD